MHVPSLKHDCSKCAALCCIVYDFEKSDQFGYDKPAGIPCKFLEGDGACRIHAELDDRGFPGCVRYDCYGAGQRVVQDLFDGVSWQQRPELLEPMSDAFRIMRKLHELLGMLKAARGLGLPAHKIDEIDAMAQRLEIEPLTMEKLTEFADSSVAPEVMRFLAGLREHVAGG